MKLSEPFEVILFGDKAVDHAAMQEEVAYQGGKHKRITAYALTRDAKHLVIREGMKPSRFVVRPLRAREVNDLVRDLANPQPEELWTAVQNCLVRVESERLTLDDRDFDVIDPMRGTKRVSAEGMEKLASAFGVEAVREIGGAIITRASIPESQAAPFALPHG